MSCILSETPGPYTVYLITEGYTVTFQFNFSLASNFHKDIDSFAHLKKLLFYMVEHTQKYVKLFCYFSSRASKKLQK